MEKRRFKPEDLYGFRSIGAVKISNNGKLVAYVVQRLDQKEDETYTDIFLMEVDGCNKVTKGRQITFTGKNNSPSFSPDDKHLAFISSRNEKSQIWILPVEGGEAWCLKTKESVSGPVLWTPDGKEIIYSAAVFSQPKDSWTPYPGAPEYDRERLVKLADQQHEEKKKKEEDKKENKVKVITRFRYRFDRQGYFDHVREQFFAVSVPETPLISGEAKSRQLTKGDFDHGGSTLSPDGKYLVVSARRTEKADLEKQSDLWLFDIEDNKAHLLYDAPGSSYNPLWSPCRNYIAFVGHDNSFGSSSTTTDLWILDVSQFVEELKAKGEGTPITMEKAHNVTRPLDRPLGGQGSDIRLWGASMAWQDDTLIFIIGDRGAGQIYQVVFGQEAEAVLIDRNVSVGSLAVSSDLILYIANHPHQPEELYLLGEESVQLTELNKDLLDQIEMGSWEEFTYQSDDGQEVDGWVIYPEGFTPEKQYPLVLLIHGGPHGSYGPNFMFLAQLFAAQDYVVLYTNPRGSDTYGQEFACSIDTNWGDRDYQDVMAGVDSILSRGFINPEQMFVHGWSYGGYLACWIVTQTDRFRAICAGASVTNMLSGYGTSDITFADEEEYGGQPWIDYEHLIKHSPIGHVEKVKTPLMLMHGENDFRVRVTQTEEFYVALRRLDKDVIMIRYPGEYHGPRRLVHKLDRYERLLAWFNYYRSQ